MKRILYFFGAALVAALCAISCTQEIEGDGLDSREKARQQLFSQEILITATAPDAEPETKTARFDTKFYWAVGDQISLFYGPGDEGGSCFTSTHTSQDGDDGHQGYVRRTTFRGYIEVITGLAEGSDDIKFWGIFPYRRDNACVDNGSAVVTTIKSVQNTDYSSWGNSQSVCIGRSDGLVMGFYNLCGGIMFKLSQNRTLSQITFKGNNNETVAGQVKVVMDSKNEPVISEFITQQKEISLSAPNGFIPSGVSTGDVWYYLILPPCTFSKGFTMTLYDSDGSYAEFVETRSRTIKRNVFGKYGTAIDDGLTFVEPPLEANQINYTATALVHYNFENSTVGNEVSVNHWDIETGKGYIKFMEPITIIDDYAFSDDNNLLSVTFPEGVTTIGASAFEGCENLSSVKLPSTAGSIQGSAFKNCTSLETIQLPWIISMGYPSPFAGCTNLKSFSGENSVSDDGKFIIFWGTEIEACALGAFKNKELVIPEGIESCNAETFYGGEFTSVSLPQTMKFIDKEAFEFSHITGTLTIPGSVTEIGESAFYGCNNISTIVIERSFTDANGTPDRELPTIGEYAFHTGGTTNCTIKIPGSKAVGTNPKVYHENDVWYGYKDQVVVYQADNEIWLYSSMRPSGVYGAGGTSLSWKLDGSIIPNGFDATHYSQPNITVEPTVPFPSSFTPKPINVLVFPSDIVGLGDNAFNSETAAQQLQYVSLPHSVEYIGDEAFMDDAALLAFPSDGYNLRTIGDRAFYGCAAMAGKVDFWHHESSGGGIPCSTCGDFAFQNCTQIEEVTLHECSTIGGYAFAGCTALTKVNLENAVSVDIVEGAFEGCSNLVRIAPASYDENGLYGDFRVVMKYAFRGTGLTKLTGYLQYVEKYAFSGSSIQEIYVTGRASYPTRIAERAFYGCSDLRYVDIPIVEGEIGANAFANCNNLTGLYLGATAIPDNCFYNLTSLQEVILPKVVTIGEKAFGQTRKLKDLRLGGNLTTIGNNVFYDTNTQLRNSGKLTVYFYGDPNGINFRTAFCYDTNDYFQFKHIYVPDGYEQDLQNEYQNTFGPIDGGVTGTL